jgi:hypothetical protein
MGAGAFCSKTYRDVVRKQQAQAKAVFPDPSSRAPHQSPPSLSPGYVRQCQAHVSRTQSTMARKTPFSPACNSRDFGHWPSAVAGCLSRLHPASGGNSRRRESPHRGCWDSHYREGRPCPPWLGDGAPQRAGTIGQMLPPMDLRVPH